MRPATSLKAIRAQLIVVEGEGWEGKRERRRETEKEREREKERDPSLSALAWQVWCDPVVCRSGISLLIALHLPGEVQREAGLPACNYSMIEWDSFLCRLKLTPFLLKTAA